ncbi:hypothetical protein BTVI_130415 [Pitangus sulphuratus]|nr:hypothetical protein BTVI_130415 [Pitangus sulphuratus]
MQLIEELVNARGSSQRETYAGAERLRNHYRHAKLKIKQLEIIYSSTLTTPPQTKVSHNRLLRTVYSHVLNISKDGDYTSWQLAPVFDRLDDKKEKNFL